MGKNWKKVNGNYIALNAEPTDSFIQSHRWVEEILINEKIVFNKVQKKEILDGVYKLSPKQVNDILKYRPETYDQLIKLINH